MSFDGVFEGAGGASEGALTAIGLMLLLGACGKSAQFPLQSWLGDAMAGPTPVSALIHAATMVTAGVYLVVRSAPVFDGAPDAQLVVVIVGAITLLFGAIVGTAKDDIKKALAASTMSQIGYMMLAAGLGPVGYAFAIFHLLTHGFFKAGLFLGAGSVMHGMNDQVEMRRFGGLSAVMKITWVTFVIGWLAIIGVPPLSGFWSKDKIIEAAFVGEGWRPWVFGGAALLGAGITAFYMTRLFFMTFHGKRRWTDDAHPHESPTVMTVPTDGAGDRVGRARAACSARPEPSSTGSSRSSGEHGEEHPVLRVWVITDADAGAGGRRASRLAYAMYLRQDVPAVAPAGSWLTARGAARPLPGRGQRVAAHAARPVPHPLARLLRQPRRRRVRQRPGRADRWHVGPVPAPADRVRPLLRAVHVRGRGPGGRRHAAGEAVAVTDFPWLTTLAVLPLVGSVVVAAMPAGRDLLAKQVALARLARRAGADRARWRCSSTPTPSALFQFEEQYSWIPQFGVSYAVGVDGIALVLVALAAVLTPVCILASWHDAEGGRRSVKTYFALLLLLETFMIGVFSATDVFLFYVLFEAMLVPMYFIIGSYGGAQRQYAAVKFLLYSLFGGLLMLAAVVGLFIVSDGGPEAFLFENLLGLDTGTGTERLLFLGFFVAFAIKAPLWPVHTWLPDAAAESPPGGAVLLVGVLDKVGTFGMIRFCLPLFPDASKWATPVVIVLCRHQHPVRRAARDRPDRPQAAHRLHVDLALRLHRARHLRDDEPGPVRLDAVHGQPRLLDRRAVPDRRVPDQPPRARG